MKFTGEIQSVTKDWQSDKFIVSLTMNEALPVDEVNSLMNEKLSVEIKKVDGHWKFYKSNGKFNAYLMIKGTSEYDTKEMAHFLDMVIDEAKALGIQTETPNEIERMKALWR